jgi:hypothetical protein
MVVIVLMAVPSSKFTDVCHSARFKRQCDRDFDAQALRQHADSKVGIHLEYYTMSQQTEH